MRERINRLDASHIINGYSYNDYKGLVFDPEALAAEIDRLAADCGADAFVFGSRENMPDESVCALARLAAKRKYKFGIIYAYQFPPPGKRSLLNAELVEKIKNIAGDLFLGEYFGETGTNLAAKDRGYYVEGADLLALQMPPQDFADMREAKEHYVAFVGSMVEYDRKLGLDKTMLIEPTAFQKYNLEAGIGTATLEVMPGNPESLVAFTRGASIGYGREQWFGYIANEWYGGYYHEDPIKPKRLALAYRWLYMSGANMTNLESGGGGIHSFGYDLEENSPECTEYRRIQREFAAFLRKDKRLPCGPLARVAFLYGNLDGFTEFLGGSSWCQFGREEWGKGAPERSWNILDEVYRAQPWFDFAAHGEDGDDLSHAPAYGMYDVIPAESPVEVFRGYDLLIFAGWHTMTAEILENLKTFVREGGHLVLSAAHLNPSARRGAAFEAIEGVSDLIGCEITGVSRVNSGIKFRRNTRSPKTYYPGPKNLICDANFPCGFADWADVTLKGGRVVGLFSDTFDTPSGEGETRPFLIENDFGKGLVSFLTNADYPGHSGVYPIYRTVVKELLTASHRACDLKVICGDKVRFSLFYDDRTGEEKVYLLNTDFGLPAAVVVKYRGTEHHLMLKPLAMRALKFEEEKK